jgi:hypothetical protein
MKKSAELIIAGISQKVYYYAIHLRGTKLGSLIEPLRRYFHRLNDLIEERYERQMGLTTSGDVSIKQDLSQGQDAVYYQPTRYFTLKSIFKHMNLGADNVFVDIGCGKGRVLLFAAQYNLRKVIGIEMDSELANAARAILQRVVTKTPVEIIQSDAATCDLSEGTVFYMFNPFGERTMKMVLDNIERSWIANPREIWIVYGTPIHASVLNASDWLLAEEIPGLQKVDVKFWRSSKQTI